mmetsp:Transcript_3831/g.5805  ORF Transcript_3831/g.5805 Transcript_3831/m.5805 type:complete len:108 (-) Transcript_3831:416-739(-)|eukprot:CAMPEP_0170483892 /NCGR_PEP_ID=MMETSP0208-20121228/3481_1 /TAXON_ID=197538 /ORGANISM="Strombidium inclinatum, Strain S3" /LENGTH=107 /DNA_ID=CAMNT_0010757087 /DNA_START=2025 /DNA_END=2348 /DNA_ORIENTATION=-
MTHQPPLSPNTSKIMQQNFEKMISQSDRGESDKIPAPSKLSGREPSIPRSPAGFNGFNNMENSFFEKNEFSSVTEILNNPDHPQPLQLQASQSIVKNDQLFEGKSSM